MFRFLFFSFHFLIRILNPRRRVPLFVLLFGFGGFDNIFLFDFLFLRDKLLGLALDEIVELLLGGLPAIVLAILASGVLVLPILVGGESTEEFPIDPIDFVFLEFIPELIVPLHRTLLHQGFHCLLGLLFWIEDYVAGGVVYPLDLEMRVCVEVLPYTLVWHVIHTEQVPSVVSDLSVLLREVWILSLVEEFWIGTSILDWSVSTLRVGKNFYVRCWIRSLRYCISWISDNKMPSKYSILPDYEAFWILYIL